MLGDADAVGTRRVDDKDALRAGRGHVHIVDAGAGASDDSKVGSASEKGGVDFGRAADQKRIRVRKIGGEHRWRASSPRVYDPPSLSAEQLQR